MLTRRVKSHEHIEKPDSMNGKLGKDLLIDA